MTALQFQQQAFSVLHALQDDLENHPLTEEIRAQKDWPALRASVRGVAEDLMLCTTIDEAIAKLRQDRAAALGVLWLVGQVSNDDSILAMKRAYSSMSQDTTPLLLYPFAAFLIQMCDDLELTQS